MPVQYSQLLRKLLTVATGQFAVMGLIFLRNLFVARLLPLEDVAVAAYLSIVVGTLEMVFEAGLSKYLVQAPGGDSSEALGAVHAVSVTRGLFIGVMLGGLAYPLSRLLSCSEAWWGFCTLGLFPMLRGFMHCSWIVEQRQLRFGATNSVEILGQLASLFGVLLCSLWLYDWRVGLVGILVQAGTNLIVSHWLATTSYCMVWAPASIAAIRSFCLPLVANGALVAITIYGDRFLLGASSTLNPNTGITLEQVGAYNVVFALAFTLSMGLFRIIVNFFLPILAASQHEFETHSRKARKAGWVIAGVSGAIVILAMFGGSTGIRWLYGQRYDLGQYLITLIAIGQSIRVLRAGTNLISLSLGDTMNILSSNIVRSIGLLLVFGCISAGGRMEDVVAAGIIAESMALVSSAALLRWSQRTPVLVLFEPIAIFAAILSASLLAHVWIASMVSALFHFVEH